MSLILPAGLLRGELLTLCASVEGPYDQLLVCPSLDWVRRFGAHCVLNVPRPMPGAESVESADCDDAAQWAKQEAGIALRKDLSFMQNGYGYAVGFCRVLIELDLSLNGIQGNGLDEHLTNLVRCPEGWFFLEPQTGQHEPAFDAVARGVVAVRFVCV